MSSCVEILYFIRSQRKLEFAENVFLNVVLRGPEDLLKNYGEKLIQIGDDILVWSQKCHSIAYLLFILILKALQNINQYILSKSP